MHMVVWGLPATTRARLFLKQASTYILQPDYGISVPHYFEFKSSGFLTSSAADISSDLYFETSIGENEFIFVPQTMVISIDNSHTGTNTAAIKMCYVDASNFKRFTELLRLDFKATGDESIWKQMRELESLNFDYHMLREPPTLMYHSEGLRAEAAGQSSGSEKGTATRRNRGAGMRGMLVHRTYIQGC